MSRVKTCCSHNLFQLLIGRARVSAGTKKLFSLLSITSHSSLAFHKVSVTIYNSECPGAVLRAGAFPLAVPAHRGTDSPLSLPAVSNAKNVDPGKFPLHYCYCLNNVTNDLTGGYTGGVGSCMCLSWIISSEAESHNLSSAGFLLLRKITMLTEATAVTRNGWLLGTWWITQQTQPWIAAASESGIRQVTAVVYSAERPPFPPWRTKSSAGETCQPWVFITFSTTALLRWPTGDAHGLLCTSRLQWPQGAPLLK